MIEHFPITESNIEQILSMQQDCYQKRVGTVYGDFKVIDVWYDWDTRKQMWKLECIKCGKIKVTHNGRDYRKGKNRGICTCESEKLKAQKFLEKQKELDDRPDNPKWFGCVIGNWKVIEYTMGKGWLVECMLCGVTKYHSPSRIKGDKPVKCICEIRTPYRDPSFIGKRFGHLTVRRYVNHGRLECECDCGGVVHIHGGYLVNGDQVTCGVECPYHKERFTPHGLSGDRLYGIWRGMLYRCYNPASNSFVRYGGRGIEVCEDWRNDVFAFRDWALSNGYTDDLSIDRIDPNGNYCPDNCRWATAKEQANNQNPKYTFTSKGKRKTPIRHKKTLEINGVVKTLEEWYKEYNITQPAVAYRMRLGMTREEAIITPKQAGVKGVARGRDV